MTIEQLFKTLDDSTLLNMFDLYVELESRSVKDDLILDIVSKELSARNYRIVS